MAKQPFTLPATNTTTTRNTQRTFTRNRNTKVHNTTANKRHRLGSVRAHKRKTRNILPLMTKAIMVPLRFALVVVKHVISACLRQLKKPSGQPLHRQGLGNNRTPLSDTQVHSVVFDPTGQETLRLSHRTQDFQDEQDGSMETRERFENLQLTNGQIWNFAQMARPGKDAIHVGHCFLCPEGAYTPTSLMRTCYHCGRGICPQHLSRCSDGHIRCKRCNILYRAIHDGLKPIFYKKRYYY